MKAVPILCLGAAALVLGWIAWKEPRPTERPVWAGSEEPHVPLAIVGELPEGEVVRELEITGMCCQGCTRKLYAALLAQPGVSRAAVDFEHTRAAAVVPSDFDVGLLEKALTFDKYVATRLH